MRADAGIAAAGFKRALNRNLPRDTHRRRVDDQTIQRAKQGSRDAQAMLLRELQDPWYRLAHSLSRDADRAREATQETALRFLRLLPTFRGDSKLQTWSMGIVIN